MAPSTKLPGVLTSRELHVAEPLVGVIWSVIIVLASITVISGFLTQRMLALKTWRLPFVVWLVFLIYIDSYLFVFVTAILQFGLGVNTSISICDGAILLCLVCYVTTKLIYLFLVERAHVVRGTPKHRLRSKLYLFNSFGMLGVYIIIAILNFIFRITRLENQLCIIGMQKKSMIPLISFDAVVNIYLTILFIIPLRSLYSFKNFPKTQANINLRTLALRTCIGAVCTLTSSIVNLTVLMVLNGEPGWVCLMCCNSDILFSAAVVHWVTSKDHAGTDPSTNPSHDRSGPGLSSAGRRRPHPLGAKHIGDTEGAFEFDDASSKTYPRSHAEECTSPDPRRPSSQKRVLDDAGAMGGSWLALSGGNSHAEQEAMSSASRDGGFGLEPPRDGGVVVTTTISRESRPGTSPFEMGPREARSSHDDGEGRWPRERRSDAAGVFGDGGFMAHATTQITGGRQGNH